MRARHAARTQFRLPRQVRALSALTKPQAVTVIGLQILAGIVIVAAVFASPPALVASTTDTLNFLQHQRDACQVMLDSATTSAQRTRARTCISDVERAIAALLASPTPTATASPTGTPTGSPTATPSPTVSPTVSPTPSPSPTVPTPTPSPSPPASWPGPTNTGIPRGVTLTGYTGPCVIDVPGTVIDSKAVSCDLVIRANNVLIWRSKVNGQIVSGGAAFHFDVVDSEIDGTPGAPEQITAIGDQNFTLLRVNVYGGSRSVLCEHDCTVRDSWLHGQEMPDGVPWHLSAIRLSQRSTVIHNTLSCDKAPNSVDGGCSANQTGYPDFEPTRDWLVQGNLFVGNIGVSYCAYGGNSQGKPFSNDPTNATNIVYRDNVFERGSNGKCGFYGPVTDFAPSRPGNIWSGNVWSTGEPVNP